jgi:hypothetical protein
VTATVASCAKATLPKRNTQANANLFIETPN